MSLRFGSVLVLLLAACGGNVVVDKGASGGAGGATTSSTSATTSTTSTAPVSCASHDDCPGGQLCVLSSGTCADTCGSDLCEGCTVGTVCNDCATSSCPSCADCLSACTPITPERCDANDGCGVGVCNFNSRTCAQACSNDADCGGFSFCDPCFTSSCCGCEDCVGACVGGE